MRLIASIERSAMIQAEFLGARAEAGRALNILKSTAKTAERAQAINDLLNTYGGNPGKFAKLISELDNPEAAARFARKAVKATTWEQVIEAWKAGLLTSPVTHAANIIGNTTFAALRIPIDAVAAGIGLVRGGADHVTAMEPIGRMVGSIEGVKDGLKLAATILKHGEEVNTKAESYRKAIPGVSGEIIRSPFRALSAEDALFRTSAERGEAYSLAIREASKEGLNPFTREFRERVVEIVQNPTEEMQAAITEAGKRFTFNTELGPAGQAVQTLVRRTHTEFLMPFIRTPANIAKELVRMTPFAPAIGEWRAAIAKGGAEGHKAIAELMVGSAISGVVVSFAMDGKVSGQGDADANKRRVQLASGWQPYSIKVGDKWYSYQRLQPVGTLMGLAADMASVWDRMTEEESDKIPKMLSVAFANAITNQTFLQGITNVVKAMEEPDRFGPKFVHGLAGSIVPAVSNFAAQIKDPVAREVNSSLDAVRARIPGLREELLPKRDVFGEPIQVRDKVGGIMPITVSPISDDPVRKEAARLNIGVGPEPKKIHVGRGTGKIGDVKLTPEQRDVFETVSGKIVHEQLTTLMESPVYAGWTDEQKQAAFKKAFTLAHRVGRSEALSMEDRQAVIDKFMKKIGQ
jgi:hypothetical protein